MLSEKAHRFADAAQRFCRLIEIRGEATPGRLLLQIQYILAELCFEAMSLPTTTAFDADPEKGIGFLVENIDATVARLDCAHGVQTDENAIRCGMKLGEWWKLFSDMEDQLRHLKYWTIDSPVGKVAPTAELRSFADDVADIYRDVRWGLSRWDNGGPASQLEALELWSYSFRNHWGAHAMDLLRAIHALIHEDKEDG